MEKFLIFIGSSVVVILIFAVGIYSFAIKKNNQPQPQINTVQETNNQEEKKEEINNNQEEKKEEEIINHANILDKTIINIIIFLLISLIAFLFVYFVSLSPVVNNNKRETVFDQIKKKVNESPFRRKVLFQGERYLKEKTWWYFYYCKGAEKNVGQLIAIKENKNDHHKYKFEDGFNPNECLEIKKCYKETKIRDGIDEKIKNFRREIYDYDKENFFDTFFISFSLKRIQGLLLRNLNNLDDDGKYLKDLCKEEKFSNQELSEYFKGKVDFFHKSNIIAALLSYGFFCLFFLILYFVLYFLYALIYLLFFLNEEEKKEENKILIAFYKALHAITFFNLRSFLKIIPILVFLIVLFYDGYLFFSSTAFLIPIFYDISDPKMTRIMKIHEYDEEMKDFLESRSECEITHFPINHKYDGTYFTFPEKPLEKELK